MLVIRRYVLFPAQGYQNKFSDLSPSARHSYHHLRQLVINAPTRVTHASNLASKHPTRFLYLALHGKSRENLNSVVGLLSWVPVTVDAAEGKNVPDSLVKHLCINRFIENIFVTPNRRGTQGIGSALLEELIRDTRQQNRQQKQPTKFLTVALPPPGKYNDYGERFFASHGFQLYDTTLKENGPEALLYYNAEAQHAHQTERQS